METKLNLPQINNNGIIIKVHITSIFSMTTNMCPTVVLKAYNYICIFYLEFTYSTLCILLSKLLSNSTAAYWWKKIGTLFWNISHYAQLTEHKPSEMRVMSAMTWSLCINYTVHGTELLCWSNQQSVTRELL